MGSNEKRQSVKKKSGSSGEFWKLFHLGQMDVIFCCFVILLLGIGLVMMYSASYAYAGAHKSSTSHYFVRQLIFGLLGLAAMMIISFVDYRILNSWMTPCLFVPVSVILMLLALVMNRGDTIKRWIQIGPISIQPSELMKFVVVLTMAYIICILSKTLKAPPGKRVRPDLKRLKGFEKSIYYYIDNPYIASFFMIGVVGCFMLLVLIGKHLSGTILVALIGLSMIYLSGIPKWVKIGLLVGGTLAVCLVVMKPEVLKLFSTYAYERVAVWKAKATVGSTTYWQTWQGLLAIGSGGPFGLGFGNSKQKLLYVPEPQNDYVFAIACEELGYVGALLILLLFAMLIVRGFMIASKTSDYFGSLLCVGIMMQIGLQVALNIAVVTDTIPNTGVPFPFFSYGGSALFFLLCEMGVVLSVSRRSYLDKE